MVARPGAVLSVKAKMPELASRLSVAVPEVGVAVVDSLIVTLFAWPPETALISAWVSSRGMISSLFSLSRRRPS